MLKFKSAICFFIICIIPSYATENLIKSNVIGDMTCISSNGIPDHEIGKFPNRANPNEFREQQLTFCFPSVPRLTERVTWGLMTVGVSTSGIPLRPYTAEYFDPATKRGFSKNSSSGWRKQAMHNPRSLGMDKQNGHVDRSGLYHYHSISKILPAHQKGRLVGYAPDGFKIIYHPDKMTSSWKLKTGERSSPPGGRYNGQFEEDFEYRINSGSLDECNGAKIDNEYRYFATDSYPFFPRCFKGEVNLNFMVRK